MKRKLISVLLCLLMITSLVFTASAEEPKIIDNADLFSYDEIEDLEQKANELVDTYDMDVVILTIDDLEGKSPQDYADDYYDDNGYGIGPDYSGVLFLIAMDTREWYISTCGDAIYALTDYGIESIFSEMSYDLADDEFYDAFDTYLDTLPEYFEAYKDGDPIDGYAGSYDGPGCYSPGTRSEVLYYDGSVGFGFMQILISLAVGLAVAAIAIFFMRSAMNTAKAQRSAGSYLKEGSYDLRVQRDLFLYSSVSKTRKAQNNSSGGSRGGGSSVHRSSGGRSHGGGGGRF